MSENAIDDAELRDHVRDRSGVRHGVVMLGHDVAAFQGRTQA